MINTRLRTTLRTTLAATAVLGTLVLAGCSDSSGSAMPGMGSSSSAMPSMGASSAATPSASSTATFNDADVKFAQMMTPHHQQAVEMSTMILAKKGVDADVTTLANQIKDAQQPEIATMQGWLAEWGQPSMGGMAMGGSGEMTQSDMDALDKADAKTGQKMYLQGMVKHHTGAIQMAKDEVAAGKNPDAIALAKSIISSQQEEITTINGLLAKL